MKLNIYGSQPVMLPRDPLASMEAATKNYVDSGLIAHAANLSLHLTAGQNTLLDNLSVNATSINYLSNVTSDVQAQLNSKVNLSGGAMSGFLTLTADPVDTLHAATKQYTDAADALKVAKTGDTMTGFLTLHANPTSNAHASNKAYVDSSIVTHTSDLSVHLSSSQNTFIDAITVTSTEVNQLASVSGNVQTQLNSKLPLAGGTLTGTLTLAADPTAALHSATKQYTDSQDALKVAKSGDTMSGFLTLHANPTSNAHASNKAYVDSSIVAHTSDTSVHLTSGQNTFIDAITVTSAEVNQLANVSSNVQTQLNSKLALAGGTMTGAITLASDPTAVLHPATKQYTDASDALKVAKAGDTLTGFLTLHANPTAALHPATKQYVDSANSTHAADASLHLTSGQNTLLDAITVSSTEINRLSGVTSDVQTQLDTKFAKAGGTVTGDITLAAGKTVFVDKTPAAATELVNKAYVDSLVNGREWKDPVSDVNLINTALSTPPGSPVAYDTYIVGAAATGAWVGKEGYATFHNGTSWVFLQTRAVIVGDRFGVGLYTGSVVDASISAHANKTVTITNATPGSIVVSDDTLTAGATTLVFDPDSKHFGVSFTLTDALTWVPTNTSVNLVSGTGLELSGNILNAKLGKGIAIDTGSVNNPIAVSLYSVPGLFFTLDGTAESTADNAKLSLKLNGTTLSKDASGLFISSTVMTDIADRVSKSVSSAVSATITINTGYKLKLTDAPVVGIDAANKTYVDGADTAIQSQVTVLQGTVSTLNTDPTTLTYVNAQDALKVAKSGDTMSGFLTLNADPTSNLHSATKQYVDNNVSTHANNASLHLTAGQNTFIDAITATAAEVNQLTNVSSNVQTQLDSKLPLAGGTLTGTLSLAADPTGALQAATKQYVDSNDALKVAKAGDTLTGFLTLHADPTSNAHAATKAYVDSNVSTHASNASLHLTVGQNAFIDAVSVTATEVNQLTNISSNVQTQLDSKLNLTGGTLTGALVLNGAPTAGLHPSTKTYSDTQDALKVNKTGDTLTGYLTLHADPVLGLQPATKQYTDTNIATHVNDTSVHMTSSQNLLIDAITVTSTEINSLTGITSNAQTQLDSKLNLTGGTMTGAVTLAADPIAALQPATKQYADAADALKVAKAGDTMTGFLTLNAAPTAALHASTKGYVDSASSTLTAYADAADALKVAKAGDVMTGFLTLNAAPTAALHASTKGYVDSSISTLTTYVNNADSGLQSQITSLQSTVNGLNTDPVTKSYVDSQDGTKVNKAGDTLTGYLTLHADPSSNMHPATKQYVDAVAVGLQTKPSVRVATTANLVATYNNGASGVNATLTATSNGALVVDGKTPIVGDRILVKDQTTKLQNGAYTVQQVGNPSTPYILKRVETINESSEVPGSYFYTYDGNTLKGTGWVITVADPITFNIGTNDIDVNQFSGQGSMIAGNGLTLTGNTLNVNTASATRIVVNADNIDLATTGVTPGNYTKVVVDGYGRITSATNPTTLAGYGINDGQPLNANLTSLSGVAAPGVIVRDNSNNMVAKAVAVTGSGLSVTNSSGAASGDIIIVSNATNANTANALVARDASGNFSANTVTANLTGNASSATILATAHDISASGDVNASAVSFNGSSNVILATTLSETGVVAGTYFKVTTDAKGRLTAGENPTTVAGFGITDAYTKTESDAKIAELEAKLNDLHLYIMSRL